MGLLVKRETRWQDDSMNQADWIRKRARNAGRGCIVWPLSLLLFLGGCSVSRLYVKSLENRAKEAGLEEHYLDLEDTRLHYWMGGEGPPLLLLHGFGGDGLRTWANQIRNLAKSRTLIVPDLVFFGQSDSDGTPDLDLQVESMLALLRHLGLSKVDTIGISYGGFVTLQMHRDSQADEVGRLVVVDSPGGHFTKEDEGEMLERFGASSLEEVFIPKDWQAVRRLMGLVFYRRLRLPPWVYRDIKEQVFSANQDTHRILLTELRGRENDFFETDWTQTEALIIWGEEDEVFPKALGEALATTLEADMVVLENAAHGPNIEHPQRFNRVVLEWLQTSPL